MMLKDIPGNKKKIEILHITLAAAAMRGDVVEPMLFICSNIDYAETIAKAISEELHVKYSKISSLPTSDAQLTQLLMDKHGGEVVVFDLNQKIVKNQEPLLIEAITTKQITTTIGHKQYARKITLPLADFVPIFLVRDIKNFPEDLRKSFEIEIRWNEIPQEYFRERINSYLKSENIILEERSVNYLEKLELSNSKLKKICARIRDYQSVGHNQDEIDIVKMISEMYLIE